VTLIGPPTLFDKEPYQSDSLIILGWAI